jgi:phosphoserine phosphatase RsbU/P
VRNPLLVDRGIKSLLGMPLLAGGKGIGVLHVGSLSGRPFGQQGASELAAILRSSRSGLETSGPRHCGCGRAWRVRRRA